MAWFLFIIAGLVLAYHYISRYRPFAARSGGSTARRPSNLPVDAESQYLLCTFSLAAKVIAADGEITKEEMESLEQFIKEELSLSNKEQSLAWRIFQNALEDELEMRDYAQAFRKYFPDRVQLTDRVVATLLEIASSDGYVHSEEEKRIRTAALLLDIPEPAYERLKAEVLKDDERYN